ncbi:MAG: hypothetical protein HN509_13690 [Halobacteriovoraceae bacterium]|jgi:predicted SnoaL-like aldol condensation-catalyzing enzyme|nr:hypothetical protein [Halobacteriovoraceae bacterium]MBT5093395.1 hypothetical protein [Halobacteriovoraceae bacterium]
MSSLRKQKIYDLLKGIETGEPESVKVVNEEKYIQHNPQTIEGGEGLAQLFARLSKTNPKVEIVRLFEDGDYVFGHTIYDFSSVRIGFEVFRYEGDFVVEHWDNIQLRVGDMVGGSTEVYDHELTEENRKLVRNFIQNILIEKRHSELSNYIDLTSFLEHSTLMDISKKAEEASYEVNHRILAEGNFVLTVSEGQKDGEHSSFYDLFRVENGMIVEHWDTTEVVPAKNVWKNENGKF